MQYTTLCNLIKQLEKDEGIIVRVYKDSKGNKTVGIGHLIDSQDPEWLRNLEIGDIITRDQIDAIFNLDLAIAINETKQLFHEVWADIPENAKIVLISMCFNLGLRRLKTFKKMIKAVNELDWPTVSKEMLDSNWAKQVGFRAYRLSNIIDNLPQQ